MIEVKEYFHPLLMSKLQRAVSIGATPHASKYLYLESAKLFKLEKILKAAGVSSIQSAIGTLRMMNGNGSKEFAMIDLIHPTTYVPVFHGTFTQSKDGLKVDNTSGVDTGVSPSQLNTDGHISESTQNIFLYTTAASIQVGTTTDYGAVNTTGTAISWRVATKPSSAVCVAGQRNPVAGTTPNASPATFGWYYGYHNGSALANESYMNGTLTANHSGDASFSSGFTRNLHLGCSILNGTRTQYAEGQYSVCGIGAGSAMNGLMATTIKALFDEYAAEAAVI